MGVDEALLMDAVENGVATLRFYQWSEPTLSLGYFQRYADREQHTASRNCAVVRRQTGGGAILHDRELTYSLALPANHRIGSQRGQPLRKCPPRFHSGDFCRRGRRNPPERRSEFAATMPRHNRPPSRFSASSANRRATWSSSKNPTSWQPDRHRPPVRLTIGKSWAAPNDAIAARSCNTAACCWSVAGRPGTARFAELDLP